MLRTPAFGAQTMTDSAIKDGLNSELIHFAFYIASTALLKELEKVDWNWEKLNAKQKFSIQKYWKRMCFRPTPFGLFGVYHTGLWKNKEDKQLIVPISSENDLLLLPDFRLISYLAENFIEQSSFDFEYHLNQTIYQVGDNYRFFFQHRLPSTDTAEILSIDSNLFIKRLIKFFEICRKKASVITFLRKYTKEPEEMLETLLAQQIVFSETAPNIAGEFYGKRVKKYNLEFEIPINDFWTMIYGPIAIQIDKWKLIMKNSDILRYDFIKNPFYAISRGSEQLELSTCLQPLLLEVFEVLKSLYIHQNSPICTAFKEQFQLRYEQQVVPLLIVLDPEYGVGYDGLNTSIEENEITEGLTFNDEADSQTIKWTQVQGMLMSKLATSDPIIEITDEDLLKIPMHNTNLPPAMQMIFQKVKDKLIIGDTGGANGFYLFSRFSMEDSNVFTHCKDIAEMEKKTNSDVVFADVTFIPEEHAANINIKQLFYSYEIPILNYSTVNPDQRIDLSDLYVTVDENRIVLISKKLNKRIIPRFSSAYNYTRSNNAIIRFLGDLQFEGITSNLTFNFSNLIPNLFFYPRVVYKDAILSEATWFLAEETRQKMLQGVAQIKALFLSLAIPRFFSLVEQDQVVIFDQFNNADLDLFLKFVSQSKQIVLKEILHAFEYPDVINTDKEPLVNQFVCSFINNKPSYTSCNINIFDNESIKPVRTFNPGNTWTFVKLYGHPQFIDDFLALGFDTFLKKLVIAGIERQWFFVRFSDPEPHLRIRIKSDQVDKILHNLNFILSSTQFRGRYYNIKIDSYERELERYIHIGAAEQLFQISSELILKFYKGKRKNKINTTELQFAMITCRLIIRSIGMTETAEIEYLIDLSNYYLNESGFSQDLKKQLDTKYRKSKSLIEIAFGEEISYLQVEMRLLRKYMSAYAALLRQTNPNQNHQHQISDILHMHCNRIFRDEQRKKEGIIYYLLSKYLSSQVARIKFLRTKFD